MGKISSKGNILCGGDDLLDVDDSSFSSDGTLRFSVWNEKKISQIFTNHRSTVVGKAAVLENWKALAEVEYNPETTSLMQIYQNTASLSILRMMVAGTDKLIHDHDVSEMKGPFSVGVFGTNKCCHHLEILKTVLEMVREKWPEKECLAVFNSTAEEIWDPANAKIIEEVKNINNCELSFQGVYNNSTQKPTQAQRFSTRKSLGGRKSTFDPRLTIDWNHRTSIHTGAMQKSEKRDVTRPSILGVSRVKLVITWAVMQHRFEWNTDFQDGTEEFKNVLEERAFESPPQGLLILVVQTSISPAYDLVRFLVHLFAKSGRIFPEQARRHFQINQWLRRRSDVSEIMDDIAVSNKWSLDMHEEKKVHDPFKTLHDVGEITTTEYIDLCERSLKEMCETAFDEIGDLHGEISKADRDEFWKAIRKYADGDLARIDATHTEQHILLRRLDSDEPDEDEKIGIGTIIPPSLGGPKENSDGPASDVQNSPNSKKSDVQNSPNSKMTRDQLYSTRKEEAAELQLYE